MRSVAEAQARILERVAPLAAEDAPLREARGRRLAADVVAARALPGFDSSAMDGFAVRAADLPGELPVAATVVAGPGEPAPLAPGTAVRIMTGAPLPPGADAVVIFEDADASEDRVRLPAAEPGANVRRAGEDVAPGDHVLAQGARLGPGELGIAAALGFAELSVVRRPRIAIVATGDELIDVATEPGPGQVVDSSAYALAAQVTDAGGAPTYLGIAPDDRARTAEMIAHALGHDVVVTTGGVSAGDRDYVRDALVDAGVELDFWKVAMKPGKPLAFGTAGPVLAFGLPGNPVSSMVAFELFVRPALLAMLGAPQVLRPRAPVVLAAGYRKPAGRAHYLRARLRREAGRLFAEPHAHQGSHALTSMVGVDALVEIEADATEVPPGGVVPALILEPA